MLQGYPDWHNPHRSAGHLLFAAYDTPGTFLSPPSGLPVAEDATKTPEFRLDLYSQDLGASGVSTFGLLAVRFRLDYDLTAAREVLLANAPHLRVNPLEVEEGWVRFSAPAAFKLPEALRIPRRLDPHGTNLALHLSLEGADADLFLEMLRRGLSTIFAEVLVIRQGIAPRVANVVTFNPSTLHAVLWGTKETISGEALYDAMAAGITTLPLRFTKPVTDDDAKATAQALLDRFAARFGKLELSPNGVGSSPYLRATPADVPSSEVRFDLDQPVLVPRGFILTADPLGSARALSAVDFEKHLVQRIDAPAFHSGWRQITVAGNLPKRRIGVLLLGIEISAPPFLPARPHTAQASVELDAETAYQTVDLRLSPDEPLRFTWRTLAVLDAGGTAQSLEGPVQTYEGNGNATFLVVPPSAFEASFVILEADPSFLVEAQIEIRVRGSRGTASWAGKGVLDENAQELAVFVPRDVIQPELIATAVSRSTGVRIETEVLPLRPTRLDPFSFPGTGARRALLKASFTSGIRQMLVECAPQDRLDDPSRRRLVRLTPAAPEAEFSYVAFSPFRAGYCWRWAVSDNTPAGAWSAPLNPDTPLLLALAPMEDPMPTPSPLIIDGVELSQVPDEPRAYFYRPTAAGIASDTTGRKQISLIEAGTVVMISLTTQWGVEGPELETVRNKLASKLNFADAHVVTLRPALVEVGEVELLLSDGSGNFKPFLKATSSGMPPYAAAFNTMLTADQAPTIKKALKGERGLLRLRYTVTERTMKHSTQSATEHMVHESATWTTTSVGREGETTIREETRTDTQASNTAPSSSPPATRLYETDAADWGLAS
ncbi:hypothetical protein COMA1_40275 [Candidatus Nitrospira nitrosa]|uniref:Uncharacterized protein n=1 Tax=Candidatus Nitrospira nitrosa TaxID=1742972 RepID=A0A0S4LMJ2_9BACT|nr:hypothetical protein [Candidatus Nitrospira nitrosa]CUS37824.1 hypothetical protein COMA1_40275 [Candidatus Nitrospira nitrosa]